MSATVRYQQYLLQTTSGKEILNTDFSNPRLELPKEHLVQVIRDLAHFSGTGEKEYNYKSLVEIATSQDVIKIERDYSKQISNLTSKKQTDPNFFWLPDDIAEHTVDDRNPFVLFPLPAAQIKDTIAKLLPKINDKPVEEGSVEYNTIPQIEQRLTELGAANLTQLASTESEIKEIEQRLAKQKEVDEAQLSVSELETKMDDVKKTLVDVEDLVKAQAQVQARLQKYAPMLGQGVMEQAKKLKTEIEQIRQQKLQYEAELLEEIKEPKASGGKASKPKFAKVLLFLPLVLIALSVVGYFLTDNLFILALGFTGGIVESLLFLAINSVEPEIDLDAEIVTSKTEKKLKQGLEIDEERMQKIQQFFLQKAWAIVLRQEVAELQSVLTNRLDGQDINKMQAAKLEIEVELEKVKDLIKGHEGKDIPPEEYLKLRRRLDMLKVEKSKLENEIAKLDNQQEIETLKNKLVDLKEREELAKRYTLPADLKYDFIAKLTDSYLGATLDKGQLWLFSKAEGKWVTAALDREDLFSIYVYVNLLYWESEKSLPMVLADILTKVPVRAKSVIDAKIKSLEQLGQIIVVEPIAESPG